MKYNNSVSNLFLTHENRIFVIPLHQVIVESWPDSLDDTCAREEWDWNLHYDLEVMTRDMPEKLKQRISS